MPSASVAVAEGTLLAVAVMVSGRVAPCAGSAALIVVDWPASRGSRTKERSDSAASLSIELGKVRPSNDFPGGGDDSPSSS